MDTVISQANAAGEWIVNHTLVPYPVESTVVLAIAAVLLWGTAIVKLARVRKSRS
jgi:hypothetical protein